MNNTITVAQFSDCHLFGDVNQEFCGANVYQNLCEILHHIKKTKVDCLIFTGDLTQDHSALSYQRFVEAVISVGELPPIYYLAGNHDDYTLLNTYLKNPPFRQDKFIEFSGWQLALIDSKSDTPSGYVEIPQAEKIFTQFKANKSQIIFTHHHPVNVGYFIDRHGLKNKDQFWQLIEQYSSIKAVCSGHVHQALTLEKNTEQAKVQIFTCPATSIQFDPTCHSVSNNGQGAGYRLYTLFNNGQITSTIKFINK